MNFADLRACARSRRIASWTGLRSCVDEPVHEELRGEDAHEGHVVPEADRLAAPHLGDQLADRLRLEQAGAPQPLGARAAPRRRRSRRVLAGRRSSLLGRAIRLLRCARDARAAPGRRPQRLSICFSSQALHLQPRRERGGELHHAVVEEREAALDGVRHRHAVALRRQDVARQQVRGLQVLRLREAGASAANSGGSGAAQRRRPRRAAAAARASSGGEERLALRRQSQRGRCENNGSSRPGRGRTPKKACR